ncbi:hypothetical protein [Sulfitobacter donghicola]|uniref:Uncharacterized protein n=1 Tax=Sulfitobacter donghicola DSW-25 = KCTC 12864 = JCM 14565 TaxID=1300350 RepID=A0A073IHY2_9RHOB|nr:hypothetical protein [Sulfitobacter donghicola]KEJ89160.1 hypothetical protein DSW25_12540 [Sulfitobacter donghicola DSW-25 = KCTC 12864 = JCM 14565]KIN67379.1 hypothetical protein Z948_1093 [Sulfitobacter donghicola DSW-25 = KCTC 12864 = JCM 14565]
MSILPLPIEEQVDEIISQLDHIFPPAKGERLTATGREILIVQTSQFFTAGHATNGVAGSQGYIRLLGSPSPSSQVTNGYIRFVPPDQIRTPTYSTERKQINIWTDQSNLPMTLAQMAHSQRYLWVGFFGAHTYGDLHSAP